MYKIVNTNLITIDYIEIGTGKLFGKFLCPMVYEFGKIQHYILNEYIHKEDLPRLLAILKHIDDETIFETHEHIKEFADSL